VFLDPHSSLRRLKKGSIPSQNLPIRSLDKKLLSPEKKACQLRAKRVRRRAQDVAEKKRKEAEAEQQRLQFLREQQEREFNNLLDVVNAELDNGQLSDIDVAELLLSLGNEKEL